MKPQAILVTALVALLSTVDAFLPAVLPQHQQQQHQRTAVISYASVPKLDERVSPTRVSRTTTTRRSIPTKPDPSALTFSGQIVKTSRPLVSLQDKQFLVDFFQSDRARNTLFVSDAPPVPIDPIPPTLFREWQTEARKLGVTVPTASQADADQQSVMQLCSNGISFSGLHVETTVHCGSKLIEESTGGLPAYELTMIRDQTQARGPRPLLWIYNQVMGVVNSSKSSNNNQKTTTSLCRISLVETTNGGVALQFVSDFQVSMKLPRFLLKVLPVSKSRAEQQGSSAVTNFVEKGVVDSLHRFETAFAAASRLAP